MKGGGGRQMKANRKIEEKIFYHDCALQKVIKVQPQGPEFNS